MLRVLSRPARFSEWSFATWDLQLEKMNGGTGPNFHFMGLYQSDDGGVMKTTKETMVGPIGGGRSQDTSQLSVFCPAASAGCARTFGWKAQDPWATRIFSTFDDNLSLNLNNLLYNQTAILGIKLPIEILVISGLASTS